MLRLPTQYGHIIKIACNIGTVLQMIKTVSHRCNVPGDPPPPMTLDAAAAAAAAATDAESADGDDEEGEGDGMSKRLRKNIFPLQMYL